MTTIVVTKEDIQKGRRNKGLYCPVALACQRTLETPNIAVSYGCILEGHHRWELPPEVKHKIFWYDMFGWMRPFSFTID